jgi:hypothetical protein
MQSQRKIFDFENIDGLRINVVFENVVLMFECTNLVNLVKMSLSIAPIIK